MEAVAYECRGPAEEDAPDAFFRVDAAPGGDVGAVDFWVDLTAAFYLVEQVLVGRTSGVVGLGASLVGAYEIEGCDSCERVSESFKA